MHYGLFCKISDMSKTKETIDVIQKLTSRLIELSLCNAQNYPTVTQVGSAVGVSVEAGEAYLMALKNVSYVDVYRVLLEAGAYNVKMIDGALIQMNYQFFEDELCSHRLAFFPSPDLAEFQNSPDVYEEDDVYAEVISKSVVPFPVRFDFDVSDTIYDELHHPKSHLTLGQYTNCRIPVSAPLAPSAFIDFILRSFYNTAHRKFCEEFPRCTLFFAESISLREKSVVHFRIPNLDAVVAGRPSSG